VTLSKYAFTNRFSACAFKLYIGLAKLLNTLSPQIPTGYTLYGFGELVESVDATVLLLPNVLGASELVLASLSDVGQ
jgi:hypothetical protein